MTKRRPLLASLLGATVATAFGSAAEANPSRTVRFAITCPAPTEGVGDWTEPKTFTVSLDVAGISMPFDTEGGAPIVVGYRPAMDGTVDDSGNPARKPIVLGVGIHGTANLERDESGADEVTVLLRRPRVSRFVKFEANDHSALVQVPEIDAGPYRLTFTIPQDRQTETLAIPDGTGQKMTLRRL